MGPGENNNPPRVARSLQGGTASAGALLGCDPSKSHLDRFARRITVCPHNERVLARREMDATSHIVEAVWCGQDRILPSLQYITMFLKLARFTLTLPIQLELRPCSEHLK